MSFRKEKKYRLSKSDGAYLLGLLHSKGMKSLHPSRKISSCYFDTNSLISFYESEEGVLPRKKVRLRWYNDIPKFTKETKISSIEGRYKKSTVYERLKNIEDLYNMKLYDNDYGILYPSIIVSYTREYYMLKNLRITFDKNIYYKKAQFNKRRINYDNEMVVEVKVPEYCPDDYIQKLIIYPISRFSKYSRGILITRKIL